MNKTGFLTKAAPIVAFIVLCVFFAIGLSKDPRALPTKMIDKPLPQFELTELRDETATLTRDALNGRVTLLNVFGSWCQACLIEHPTFLRLKDRDSFDIVGVNWRDTRPDALKWLSRHGDPYDYILFDEKSQLAISLGVTGAPETFLIDQDGRIRYKHVGPITNDVFENKIYPLITALQEN